MSNTRYYNNINYAPYGAFLDWAATVDTTTAVSTWDITLRPDWVGDVFDLTINGNVVGGFQSRSAALSALWGYHATQSGNGSVTAFEAAVGASITSQPDMGTVGSSTPEAAGQNVTTTFTDWDSAVAMPGAEAVTATLQQFSSATGAWEALASSPAGTDFTYTLLAEDVGIPKRVVVGASDYMPLRFAVVGSSVPSDSRPLERMTYIMEDSYGGGYAQAIADNPTEADKMTWVLARGNMFPRDVTLPNGNTVTITLENEMLSDDVRDAWAIAWTEIALAQLASKDGVNGVSVDGSPICLDPEDKGVDSAPGGVDMRYAGSFNTAGPFEAGYYKDSRIGFDPTGSTGYFTTEVVDALPRAIEAMKRVTDAVRAAYPNSPVGWYNGGVSFYLPGWLGADQDVDNSNSGTINQVENMLKGLTSRDTNYYQHLHLDNSDFGFVPWYRGVGNSTSTEPTANSNDDNDIVNRGYFGHFNNTNKVANALYLYIKYLGPNTTHGDAEMGDKMILGLIQGYMATDGNIKNLDGTPTLAVRAALATSSGGAYPSSDSPPVDSSSLPAEWATSGLSYPDLSGLRGAGNLFTDVIDSPYDSTASGPGIDENGVFNVPFTLPEWNDYVSWLYTEDNQDLVNAGLRRSGVPSQIFERGMPTGYEGPVELPDTLRVMRMSIFDGTMPTEHTYTPGDGGAANTVRSLNSSWASGSISSSKTRYMELLYAGYADYAGYNGKTWATQPATNEDLFPAADKANWFDPLKKAFAERVIDRTGSIVGDTNYTTNTRNEILVPTGYTDTFTATGGGNTGTAFNYVPSDADGTATGVEHYSLAVREISNIFVGYLGGVSPNSQIFFSTQDKRDEFVNRNYGLVFQTANSGTFIIAGADITATAAAQTAEFLMPTWAVNAGDELPLKVTLFYD